MKESTKRSLRTVVQTVLGYAAAVTALAPFVHLPAGKLASLGGAAVAAAATVTKAWNELEDRGLVPVWLKPGPDVEEVTE